MRKFFHTFLQKMRLGADMSRLCLLMVIAALAVSFAFQQALTDFYVGDLDKAAQGFTAELTGNLAGDAYYNLAATLYAEGKYSEMQDLLPAAAKAKAPGETFILLGDSYLYERNDDGKLSLTNAGKANDMFNRAPKTVLTDYSKAVVNYMQGSYGAAWDKLKDYTTVPACPASVLALAGMARKAMNKDSEGLALITEAVKRDDAPTSVLTAYARMLDELGHAPQANLAIGRAAARPDAQPYADILIPICDKTMAADSGLTSKIARAELALWKQDAASALNALAAAGNSDATVLWLRGVALGLLSRYQEARDNLEAALRNNPPTELAARIKAQILIVYFRSSNSQDLYKMLEQEAAAFYGGFPSPFPRPTLLDGLLFHDGFKPVEDWLDNINNSSPTDPRAALNLGTLLALEGKYPDAVRALADGMNRLSNSTAEDAKQQYELYKKIYDYIAPKQGPELPDLFAGGISAGTHLIGINFNPPWLSHEFLYYLP
jgi:tetratricopeptide (TPR) repeat protein